MIQLSIFVVSWPVVRYDAHRAGGFISRSRLSRPKIILQILPPSAPSARRQS